MEDSISDRKDETNGIFGVITSVVKLSDDLICQKCKFEGFLRCSYVIESDDKSELNVEYLMTIKDDRFRPYGIKSIVRDADNRIIDIGILENKFASVSECIVKMKMLASKKVLPGSLNKLI